MLAALLDDPCNDLLLRRARLPSSIVHRTVRNAHGVRGFEGRQAILRAAVITWWRSVGPRRRTPS